jgi:hypothetical protein
MLCCRSGRLSGGTANSRYCVALCTCKSFLHAVLWISGGKRREPTASKSSFVSAQAKLSIMPLTWPLTRGVIKRNDVYFLALRPASASLKPACEGEFA